MRRATPILFLFLLTLAGPLQATTERPTDNKSQSYFSYDDGGTILRQGDDGREIEVRINMPLFPGDEVVTSRRGRSEVRLSDGNVIAIDRATAIRLRSILDSYEGESSQTVAELTDGKAIVYRTERGRDLIRLDTRNGSYVASRQAIFSIESDANGRDRVSVFEGSIEVRTPSRSTRLRAGEQASVDDRGLADVVADNLDGADDFERWFLKRADRYDRRDSRYLDDRFAYYDDELDEHGSWVNVNGVGWSWRPRVAAGWRPYYQGYWSTSRLGCLTWVSYEPWGWLPYHYGRWSYDSFYGWVWVPGYGYSPAWVYWMYGSNYVGWAPAGWWDCHRPYYGWAYDRWQRADVSFGFGFYGRVRVGDLDLRPWVVVDSGALLSTRVDRASLTTDAIRQRLQRGGGGTATISNSPTRFTRDEFRDPAGAINRRGIGSGTGEKGTGSSADLTPFIRRDPELSTSIRERVARNRPSAGSGTTASGGDVTGRIGRTIETGGARGTDGRIGRGTDTQGGRAVTGGNDTSGTISRGGTDTGTRTPVDRGSSGGTTGRGGLDRGTTDRGTGSIDRGAEPRQRDNGETSSTSPSWRDRVTRPSTTPSEPSTRTPSAGTPSTGASSPDRGSSSRGDDSWRNRVVRGGDRPTDNGSTDRSSTSSSSGRGSSDAPRRVINGIGGARVSPGESSGDRPRARSSSGSGNSGSSSGSTRRSAGSGSSSGSSGRDYNGGGSSRGSSGGSSSSSGGSSRGSSGGSSSGGSSSGSSSGGSSRGNDGGSRVQRGNQ